MGRREFRYAILFTVPIISKFIYDEYTLKDKLKNRVKNIKNIDTTSNQQEKEKSSTENNGVKTYKNDYEFKTLRKLPFL